MAQHHAEQRARRPKPLKLDTSPQLRASVETKLKRKHSPEQISQELREEFPQNPEMWVSDETIYKAIFVQGKGLLKQEVARWLRTGRAMRRPHRTTGDRRGRIPGMVNVSERPAEVEDRAVPGHWEGDLILGAYGRSAIGTLVERQTRFVMLVPLPHGHTADQVEEAMLATIRKLPVAIWKSLTWDQGAEMANHAKITLATDLSIYFCDPSSPWQRGTNENTNGLLLKYFPKGTDLRVHSAEYLDFVADEMNDRPRKTLGWKRPRQAMQELIAAAEAMPASGFGWSRIQPSVWCLPSARPNRRTSAETHPRTPREQAWSIAPGSPAVALAPVTPECGHFGPTGPPGCPATSITRCERGRSRRLRSGSFQAPRRRRVPCSSR